MQRISEAPIFDQSLAYLAGIVMVLFFGLAAFAVSSGDLGGLAFEYDDEVKVEAARFPSKSDPELAIFAGCNGKSQEACK